METVVMVVFNGGTKLYPFKTDIEGLKINDPLVVDTHKGLAVAWIKSFTNTSSMYPSRGVVCKIDLAEYKKKRSMESIHRKPTEKQIAIIIKMLNTYGFEAPIEDGWEKDFLVCHTFISDNIEEAKRLWREENRIHRKCVNFAGLYAGNFSIFKDRNTILY